MNRIVVYGMLLLWLAGFSVAGAVDIIDLPATPETRYDLTWEAMPASEEAVCLLDVERTAAGQGYQLRLSRHEARWQPTGGPPRSPAVRIPLQLAPDVPIHCTLTRRPGRIALLLDHRLLLTAPMPTAPRGRLRFTQVAPGVVLHEARYAALDTPIFHDDFMRPEALEQGLLAPDRWHEDDLWMVAAYQQQPFPGNDPRDRHSGRAMTNPWQLSLFPGPMTANGFWLLYSGEGPSWVVANPLLCLPAWDDYTLRVAVKPAAQSTVGVLAAYQDERQYLRFCWSQHQPGGSAQPRATLTAVVGGEETILATSSRGFTPGQWYTLRLHLGWERIQVLADEEILLDAANPGLIAGRVGLYADLPPEAFVPRDGDGDEDVTQSVPTVAFDDVQVSLREGIPNLMTASTHEVERTGTWTDDHGSSQACSPGTVLTRSATWQRYQLQAEVLLPSAGKAGVVLHGDGRRSGYLWQLSPTGQRLYRFTALGARYEVAHSAVGIPPHTWTTVRAEVDGPSLVLYCGTQQVMEVYHPATARGRCGVTAASAGVAFRACRLTPWEPFRPSAPVREAIATDKWLSNWSHPDSWWVPAVFPSDWITPAGLPRQAAGSAAPVPTSLPGLYWFKGGVYGPMRITVPLVPSTIAGQVVYLAHGYNPENGYQLHLLPGASPRQVILRWTRQGARLRDIPLALPPRSLLTIERQGATWRLLIQEAETDDEELPSSPRAARVLLMYRDTHPLPTDRVGFRVTHPRLPAGRVQVASSRLEETFETAPTDWWIGEGIWTVMARFACDPRWKWYGGWGAHTPTLWSKYRLDGDQTVEAYMSIKMVYPGETAPFAQRLRDLNLTICGDGRDPLSGYALIRNGRDADGHPVTQLLRRGQVVWESQAPEHLLPQGEAAHYTAWYPTRLEKTGGEVRVYLDNRLATTYVDPDPLPGGYPAVWTRDNGVLVNRITLAATAMVMASPENTTPPGAPTRDTAPIKGDVP